MIVSNVSCNCTLNITLLNYGILNSLCLFSDSSWLALSAMAPLKRSRAATTANSQEVVDVQEARSSLLKNPHIVRHGKPIKQMLSYADTTIAKEKTASVYGARSWFGVIFPL